MHFHMPVGKPAHRIKTVTYLYNPDNETFTTHRMIITEAIIDICNTNSKTNLKNYRNARFRKRQ